ncbi:MAG: hypothetical protein Fur0042_03900 [Cyanophyceae cyanobacterium]
MQVTFANERLQKLCESKSQIQKKLGVEAARKLPARLEDLRSVENVADLIVGKPHPIEPHTTGGKKFRETFKGTDHLFSLAVDGKNRLVFQSVEDPQPLKASKDIDWSKVTRVCIVYVGDYHD